MTIDHDAIAAKVRQDREVGTPGNWITDPHDAEADQDRYDTVFADAGIQGASPLAFIPHFWSAHWVDACRIAGLPRLEAAYLDLYDEVVKLRADRKQGGLDYCDLMERHDAHFAAWQSAKSRAEKAEAERVAEWNRRREAEASRDLEKAVCATIKAERDALRAALKSIADNTCCDGCREAALVARAALKGDDQ